MSVNSERPKSNQAIYDAATVLKDAGLVAADAAATVGGNAKILDIGLGRQEADIIIDVSAIEIASNTELYNIVAQFSNSATFASGIENGASLELGATEVRSGSGGDSLIGRYKLPFTNVINDVHYRYMRLYTNVAGDIATGINYSAFVTKR